MEEFLQKLLARLTWLNVGDERLQDEFASHVGWSIAVVLTGYWIYGSKGLFWAGLAWFSYGVLKECWLDGHIQRMVNRTETADEAKDFRTDLLSRLLPVLILVAIQYWRTYA
jgi:phosphatidylglycerophosphate synthase